MKIKLVLLILVTSSLLVKSEPSDFSKKPMTKSLAKIKSELEATIDDIHKGIASNDKNPDYLYKPCIWKLCLKSQKNQKQNDENKTKDAQINRLRKLVRQYDTLSKMYGPNQTADILRKEIENNNLKKLVDIYSAMSSKRFI